eukprot:3158713-Prymnesium_polylepis.2
MCALHEPLLRAAEPEASGPGQVPWRWRCLLSVPPHAALAMIMLLVLVRSLAAVAAPDAQLEISAPRYIEPRDATGRVIPQVLQEQASNAESIMLTGQDWEPMDLGPVGGEGWQQPGKGTLHPADSILVIIDMQPLFFDARSPWGKAPSPECEAGGLQCSGMNTLWPRQLRLAHAFAEWTGNYGSIFLTTYDVPTSTNASKGIMMHYYGMAPRYGKQKPAEQAATRQALGSMCANRGCDVD